MDKLKLLAALRAQCVDCMDRAYGAGQKIIVFGEGNTDARLALVGEAPGEQETLQGRAFVGKAGKNLDGFLQVLELTREEIYITNVVKFRPVKVHPRTGSLSNRPPDRGEVALCRDILWQELGILQPRAVVTLGNVALKALLQDPKAVIGEAHGRPHAIDFPWGGAHLFPLYHPASIIYNRALSDTYQQDLQALKSWLTGLERP